MALRLRDDEATTDGLDIGPTKGVGITVEARVARVVEGTTVTDVVVEEDTVDVITGVVIKRVVPELDVDNDNTDDDDDDDNEKDEDDDEDDDHKDVCATIDTVDDDDEDVCDTVDDDDDDEDDDEDVCDTVDVDDDEEDNEEDNEDEDEDDVDDDVKRIGDVVIAAISSMSCG